MSAERTTTDRPRKIVVCNPDEYREIQSVVVALGPGDILVKPNGIVEPGTAYVCDPSYMELPPNDWPFDLKPYAWRFELNLPTYGGSNV